MKYSGELITFYFTILLNFNVTISRSDFVLTTLSLFGENDLLELKDINLFLRSRSLWSGGLTKVSCLWTIAPINKYHINLEILRQASHIASECQCRLHISNFYKIEDPEDILFLAISEASKLYKNSTVLYLSSKSIIINDPIPFFPSNLERTIAIHKSINSEPYQCDLTAVLLSSEFIHQLRSLHYQRNFKICEQIYRHAIIFNYTIVDIPRQLRYSMIHDNNNWTLNNLSILLATSSAGLAVNLYQVRIPTALTAYAIGQNYYNCEYKVLAPWKWNQDKTSILESPLSRAFDKLNLSSFTIPQFCRSIFGTILPDEMVEVLLDRELYTMKVNKEVGHVLADTTESVTELVPPDWMLDLKYVPRSSDKIHYAWNGEDSFGEDKEDLRRKEQYLLDTTIPKVVWEKNTNHTILGNFSYTCNFFNNCNNNVNNQKIINDKKTLPSTITSPVLLSECSLLFFAVGPSFLSTAFFQAYHYRSMLSIIPHKLCGNHTPNLALYTDVLNLQIHKRSKIFSNWDDISYLNLFDIIFEISDHPDYLRYWLPMAAHVAKTEKKESGEKFHDALRRTGMDVFHHSPSLWWYRISAFLHPPSRYVVAIESEVFSCVQNFDTRLFDAIDGYDIVTITDRSEPNGGSNGDAYYPCPDNTLTSEWIAFEERLLCFLLFDSYQPVIKKLFQTTAMAYSKQIRNTYLGRTFVRGDQTAFREALFHVRYQIRENLLRTESTDIFCFRWYRYRNSCQLYHGYDAASRCPTLAHSSTTANDSTTTIDFSTTEIF